MESERGSTLVISAFALAALLIFAGFAIDMSRGYISRLQMQIAADAGALGGTHMLTLGYEESEIDIEIRRLATLNGADSVSWSYTTNGLGITVSAEQTIETYFARIIPNYDSILVNATGAAGALPIISASDLMPFTFRCSDIENTTAGTIYRFWDDDKIASGNVGWLDWNGGSSSALELAGNILNPALSETHEIGEWIDATPGTKVASAVRSALNLHIGTSATIPLYGNVRGKGNNTEYQICGFARFVLTGFNFQGKDKYIEGKFLLYTARGVPSSDSDFDFGLRTIVLTF